MNSVLKNGKFLFENGEAKPEIYSKMEKKFEDINKIIERANIQLYKDYDYNIDHSDYVSAAKFLEKIALNNPDTENLYRQKAVLYHRRVNIKLREGH